MMSASLQLSGLSQFDSIIDVRSPAEFAIDHIPGAINCPVLSDEERIEVGTIYHQESPFAAKKVGARLIAQNIAHHLEHQFAAQDKGWRPLIYCWRGGKRSQSMTHILRQIGWSAELLNGGYKQYRKWVVEYLQTEVANYSFRVISGSTGSAKSSILKKLGELGEQVLDLESLANHKGSVLGSLGVQPSQKMFESLIFSQLQEFSAQRIVYVEAESKKIGLLQVPEALIQGMRQSPCIQIKASLDARIDYLISDYPYMMSNPELLIEKISCLKEIQGQEKIKEWIELINQKDWKTLIHALLAQHYDVLYKKSQSGNYQGYQTATVIETDSLDPGAVALIAKKIQAEA